MPDIFANIIHHDAHQRPCYRVTDGAGEVLVEDTLAPLTDAVKVLRAQRKLKAGDSIVTLFEPRNGGGWTATAAHLE